MHLSRALRYTGIGIVLVVLAGGPFYRGLFFWTELLAACALVSVAFGIWLLGRVRGGLAHGMPGGVAGIALLVLFGFYVLQFFWAVFPRGNIDWSIRILVGWMVFVMFRAEAGPAARRWLAWVFCLSAAGMAVVGLLEFTGYFLAQPGLADSLALVGLSNRMFTPLQYPNTAAVFFSAAIFAAIGLPLDNLKPWKLAIASGLVTLLSVAFFFTVSRGATLVLPIGLIFLFVGLTRSHRWPAVLLLMAGAIPAIGVLKGIGANAAIQNYVSAFRWIGASVIAGLLAGLVLWLFLKLKPRFQYAMAGGTLLVVILGLLLFRPDGGLLPEQASRLFDINFKTQNVVLRLIYDQDAARMVLDRPLGRGGWGWDRSYRAYQEFNYFARESHNHYAQTAVEAGLPGMFALICALGAGFLAAWKTRTQEPLAWVLASSASIIAIHSVIDFNLSYGSIWILTWTLLAVSASPAEQSQRFIHLAVPIGLAVSVGTAALAVFLYLGSEQATRAEHLEVHNQLSEARTVALLASRYDPWDSRPLRIIGDRSALEKAVRLDPYQAEFRLELSGLLEREGDLQRALDESKAALQARPMTSKYHNRVAFLLGHMLTDAVGRKDKVEAVRLADELLRLEAEVLERKAIGDPLQHLWNRAKLEIDPGFGLLRVGQALFLTGNLKEAETRLTAAAKIGLLGSEAQIWLYVMYESQGNQAKLKALEGQPWIRFRNLNPVYLSLKTW